MTIGAMHAVRALGLTVPGDVALVGFDDFEWSDLFQPRLMIIAQPTQAIGAQAVQLLLARLDDPGRPPQSGRLSDDFRPPRVLRLLMARRSIESGRCVHKNASTSCVEGVVATARSRSRWDAPQHAPAEHSSVCRRPLAQLAEV
jgi:substrate-binding family protein